MGILDDLNKPEQLKQELWDKFSDYEAFSITEEDIDLDLLDEE